MKYRRYLMAVGSVLAILQACAGDDGSGTSPRSQGTNSPTGSGGAAGSSSSPSNDSGPSGLGGSNGGSSGSSGSSGTSGTSGTGGAGGSNGRGGSSGKGDASVDARVADTGRGTIDANDASSAVEGSADDPFAMYRQPCVDHINAFRATLNLSPLTRWTAQEKCADDQASKDAASGTAHTNFGICTESAQDTCPGWPSAQQVVDGCLQQMWNEGPGPTQPCTGSCYEAHGHYINMSNAMYTKVACSFFRMSNGMIWASQDFR